MLHGAAQALLDQTGVQLEPLDARYRQESLGQACAALGDEQAQQAYARGMTLSLNQVIDLALSAAVGALGDPATAEAPAFPQIGRDDERSSDTRLASVVSRWLGRSVGAWDPA